MEVHQRHVALERAADGRGRLLGVALLLGTGFFFGGCAASNQQLLAPRYTLTIPGSWRVEARGQADGQPSVLLIRDGMGGERDRGAGAGQAGHQVAPAEVEIRIYGWAGSVNPGRTSGLGSPGEVEPSQLVATLLADDRVLGLSRHLLVPEQPLECNLAPRTYTLFGVVQSPLDLVGRPGWRAIIVGGKSQGSLVGVVARVPQDPVMDRHCQNLRNMQAQLQNLLDRLQPVASPVVPPPPPPADEQLDTNPTL